MTPPGYRVVNSLSTTLPWPRGLARLRGVSHSHCRSVTIVTDQTKALRPGACAGGGGAGNHRTRPDRSVDVIVSDGDHDMIGLQTHRPTFHPPLRLPAPLFIRLMDAPPHYRTAPLDSPPPTFIRPFRLTAPLFIL